MPRALRVGIIGDFTPEFASHLATNEALRMAARAAGIEAVSEWVPTPEVSEARLGTFDALWASPGSPYKSLDGMLDGIQFARERGKPFVAT
jgi:CTP synthase (UTP-ammonia lyase)